MHIIYMELMELFQLTRLHCSAEEQQILHLVHPAVDFDSSNFKI
jgi:hypothetical protein